MNSTAIVHLVDDDASYLGAVTRLMRMHGLQPRPFTSGDALLEALDADSRGCVVADLRMPGLSGFELQEKLARSSAPLPILFLTGQGDIAGSVRAMKLGAVDFLQKDVPANELLRSVRAALAQDEAAARARAHRRQLLQRLSLLSPRERQVFVLVIEGKLIKEMAAALDINERTVKLHRTAITRKLGVHSAALLARIAQEAGLFDDSAPAGGPGWPDNMPLRAVSRREPQG